MSSVHLCSACYTDLDHNKLQRIGPHSYRWRIAWANGLGTEVSTGLDPVVLNSFATSTALTYFIDIRHRSECLQAINILLNKPIMFDPTFGGGMLVSYVLEGHRDGCYGHCVEACPMVAAIMADPRVQAGGFCPAFRRKIAVERCAAIKGELVERAWHPDRVWDWCFDDDEKRAITAGFVI